MTDISHLASFGGKGGTLGEWFPWGISFQSLINIKNGSSMYSANNVNFWNVNGLLSNAPYEVTEMFRNVIDNDTANIKELCNITSPNGGVLTHVTPPCMDINNGVIEVEIIRDGTKTTTIQRTLRGATTDRLVLGGVTPYPFLSNQAATMGIGSVSDQGVNSAGFGLMLPLQALHLGIGLQFDSTCVVTARAIVGNLQVATNTLGYKAACLGMLRKFGE